MAAPPKFSSMRPEDFQEEIPDWGKQLLLSLNSVLSATSNALTKRLSRVDNFTGSERFGTFKTKAVADETFPIEVKHDMPQAPRHVVVSQLQRGDGVALSVWSFEWKMGASGNVQLAFHGLADSTDYRYSLLLE